MWIRTQNKQRIINSDQIIDIFIDNTGKKILAETTRDGDFFALGEYENREVSLSVLDSLLAIIGTDAPAICLPFGGETTEWKKEIETVATAYIANDLRK